jgi:CBS domain-containing protein
VIVRIRSILNRKGAFVASVHADASLHEASRLLREHGVGALVVSDDGERIDGIISERDLARALADHGDQAPNVRVAEAMTVEVRTCSPHTSVDELMVVMTEHRIRHLPVVDDETGAMVGIVSIGDVVKHRVQELEQEAQTLHEYIELGR